MKTHHKLRSKGIETGAASLFIELKNGKITVKNGMDNIILVEIDSVKNGSWDKIWEAIDNLESVNN